MTKNEITAMENVITNLKSDLEIAIQEREGAGKRIDDLENEIDELTILANKSNAYEKVLELIADHSNWKGNMWAPYLTHLEDAQQMADRVLREN